MEVLVFLALKVTFQVLELVNAQLVHVVKKK